MIGQYVTVLGDVISHVNITAVKSEDGGEYECIAKSRSGQINHAGRLNIYGMPFVRSMPTISSVAGKQLFIKCPVAGYPIDTITWEKDNIQLPTNMWQRVVNGTLQIDNVQRAADQATYSCTARNKHNHTSSKPVELKVLGKYMGGFIRGSFFSIPCLYYIYIVYGFDYINLLLKTLSLYIYKGLNYQKNRNAPGIKFWIFYFIE